MQKNGALRLFLTISVGIPMLIALALYLGLYHVNRFQLELIVLGENETTIEYGSSYTDPGAEALFHGTYLLNEGKTVHVSKQGTVDCSKVGSYTIEYCARFGWWTSRVQRTVHVVDSVRPILMLRKLNREYTIPGQAYEEAGFAAWDAYDGDLTDRVQREQRGGRVIYTVADSSGNVARVVRRIVYYDPIPPELTLAGDSTLILTQGESYEEPGFTAWDNGEGDITDRVEIDGTVDTSRPGSNTLTYRVRDQYGNQTDATRTVVVQAKYRPGPDGEIPESKVIYLTFDDGPSSYTGKLLDILKKYNVKATFFVVNTGYEQMLSRIVEEGHSIGIHSATHQYRTIYASEEAFFEDLEKMQEIIREHTGVETYLMRFPGGSSNTVSAFNPGIMTRLTAAVEERGYRYFDWNVTSGDAGETQNADKVYQNVVNGSWERPYSIVLQHDSKGYSVDAVERIICWGLKNGYSFLPLDMSSPTAHHHINN